MKKNTILFDFDFTLADSSQGIFKCINYALNKMNLAEQDYDTIKYTIGHSLPETYRILTKRNSEDEENEFVKLFVKKADDIMNLNTRVYPEVFDLMCLIKEKGYKTGIISTKYRYRIQGVLKRENLNSNFDVIVGGEDVSKHKPDPEGLLLAIEKLGVEKKQIWYVGDSLVDTAAAKRAGIEFIAVLTGTVSKESFEAEGCNYIIPNLSNLSNII